jgi:hypothetical protein
MLQSVICFSARETTGATSAEPARSHSASSREAAKCDLGRRGRGEAGGGGEEGQGRKRGAGRGGGGDGGGGGYTRRVKLLHTRLSAFTLD